MASLKKFRSKSLLNKSHNKLHGLTLYAIIVFNMNVECQPHLCTPHTDNCLKGPSKGPSVEHGVEGLKGPSMPRKEGHLLVDG